MIRKRRKWGNKLIFLACALVILLKLSININSFFLNNSNENENEDFVYVQAKEVNSYIIQEYDEALTMMSYEIEPIRDQSNSSFPTLSMPQNIDSHRPEVYINGFPVLSIEMDEPINWDGTTESLQFFREEWHGAILNVSNTDTAFEIIDVRVSARGRGNSTWGGFGGTKRPIRFRFPNNDWRPMFDAEYVGRDWILLANVMDPSHLRDFSARYLGSLMDTMHFVPDAWFVHLYLDGDYRGVYLLTDEREAIEGRANLTFNIDPAVSEYMIERDARVVYGGTPVNSNWVQTRIGPFDIRYPSTGSWTTQPENPYAIYVESFLNAVDEAILGGNKVDIEAMIDIETFVDFYIVNEFFKNIDFGFASTFFQIRGQGEQRRLYAGPLWDFDLSSGSANNYPYYWPVDIDEPIGAHAAVTNDWFRQLLATPWFREEVRNRWLSIRDNEVTDLLDRIQYIALTFEDDFQRDIARWPDHGRSHAYNSSAVVGLTTSLENAEYLHWWLTERSEWMSEFLNSDCTIYSSRWSDQYDIEKSIKSNCQG